MLPVQTVMIRYMVLVYRWGSRWLSAAGDWGGFAGGAVTGGCARRRVLAEAHLLRARKGPADDGVGGAFGGELYFDLSLSPTPELPRSHFAGLLISRYFLSFLSPSQELWFFRIKEVGLKRRDSTGMDTSIPE